MGNKDENGADSKEILIKNIQDEVTRVDDYRYGKYIDNMDDVSDADNYVTVLDSFNSAYSNCGIANRRNLAEVDTEMTES